VTPAGKKITDVAALFQIDDGRLLKTSSVWARHAGDPQKILVDNPAAALWVRRMSWKKPGPALMRGGRPVSKRSRANNKLILLACENTEIRTALHQMTASPASCR